MYGIKQYKFGVQKIFSKIQEPCNILMIKIECVFMWKLAPAGTNVSFYGYIIRGKPIVVENRRIGYKIVIRTTIKVESGNQWIPVYVSYADRSKNRRLYEWWKLHNEKEAPLQIVGKKRGQSLYRNTKYQDFEASSMILWVFMYHYTRFNTIDEIPPEFTNIRIDSSIPIKKPQKKIF